MRLPVLFALASVSAPAYAGGIGILATGGVHTDHVYYYDSVDEESGKAIGSLDDYPQFRDDQVLPNVGTGLELILGDRDDKIVGNCRFYWLMDSAQVDPTASAVDDNGHTIPADNVVVALRDEPRHMGMGLIGLSWGIVGKPEGLMLNALGHVGSAFITLDHTEYLAVDLGPSLTYRASRQVQLFGDLQYQMRLRKTFDHSGNVVLGARYLFD